MTRRRTGNPLALVGEDQAMGVRRVWDRPAMVDALGAALAREPIRLTVVGSILQSLADEAWCAVGTGPSTGALAARSASIYPAMISAGWHGTDLAELAAEVTALPGLLGLSGAADAVAELLALLGRPVAHRMDQRLFRLDELAPPTGVAGSAIAAGAEDTDLLRSFVEGFQAEAGGFGGAEAWVRRVLAGGDVAWLWRDAGRAVSLAARRPVAAGSARIGPVYTPVQYRGRGYASAVTAHATRDILADGAVPVLFTDLANPTSNAIYQRLGYRPVDDYAYVEIGP